MTDFYVWEILVYVISTAIMWVLVGLSNKHEPHFYNRIGLFFTYIITAYPVVNTVILIALAVAWVVYKIMTSKYVTPITNWLFDSPTRRSK